MGIGVVACVPTVMALVASNVPFVEVTTTVVVDPFSAVRRVPTANELAWRTATPMPCAPKSVDAMVSVVPTADEMPRHPHGAPGLLKGLVFISIGYVHTYVETDAGGKPGRSTREARRQQGGSKEGMVV